MNTRFLPMLAGAVLLIVAQGPVAAETPPVLPTVAVTATTSPQAAGYDAVVEAVRQTVVSAQVPGAVVALHVKAGDRVKSGQVLMRLDARAAAHQAGAAAAQVQAARAAQDAATREFERQKQLFQEKYISQAALDRAEAQYKATHAQAAAQLSLAGAAQTESSFYVVKAPYEGIVAEVSVVLGDMAMPGRPLLTVYDPAVLRVTAAVPQSAAPRAGGALQVELPGTASARIAPVRWQVLPTTDPATHTVQLRADLPPGTQAAPGMFSRVWLPGAATSAPRLSVPVTAVVRRAELTAVYVLAEGGRPLLRQVRLGPVDGSQVEVLAGLAAGERVVVDPQAAAKVR